MGKNISLKNMVIVIAILGLLIIGTTFSYFIDRDMVTNQFTVGNVEVNLTEPNWNPENATNITPKKEIPKNPIVTNVGVNDAYAFLSVTVPKSNVKTANDDGTLNESRLQELFTYRINNNWREVKVVNSNDKSEHIYAYVGSDNKMKKLSPNEATNSLFDNVKFINIVEGQLNSNNLEIPVEVLAIQIADLGSEVPEEILDIILNNR